MPTNKEFLDLSGLAYFKSKLDSHYAKAGDVHNGTLTINQNSTRVASFSANASGDIECTITVPTKVSDITNDRDYQTADEVDAAIQDALKDITGFEFKIVDASQLTKVGKKGTIYLIPVTVTATHNIYDEYIYTGNGETILYEKLGSTDIDLSNYWNSTNLTAINNGEIDNIFEVA